MESTTVVLKIPTTNSSIRATKEIFECNSLNDILWKD